MSVILNSSSQDFCSILLFSTLVVYSVAAEFFAKGLVAVVPELKREVKTEVNILLSLFSGIAVSGCSLPQAAAHLLNAHSIKGAYDSPGVSQFFVVFFARINATF